MRGENLRVRKWLNRENFREVYALFSDLIEANVTFLTFERMTENKTPLLFICFLIEWTNKIINDKIQIQSLKRSIFVSFIIHDALKSY